jgi:hypothetical protein
MAPGYREVSPALLYALRKGLSCSVLNNVLPMWTNATSRRSWAGLGRLCKRSKKQNEDRTCAKKPGGIGSR